MGPVPFKRIVHVSTEDGISPAKNLLSPASGKKWLCASNDKTRKAEIEFELCKKTKIVELEIGNFGSAFVEILVGCSDAEGDCVEFVTLLPQSALMSVSDCKAGRNKSKTVRYTKQRLSATAVTQKWNRVKVVCRQPFNLTEQFGLAYIGIFSQPVATSEPSESPSSDSSVVSPKSTALGLFSSTGNSSPALQSALTPKHPVTILSPHDLNNSAAHSIEPSKSPATPRRPVGGDPNRTTVKSSRRTVRDGSPLSEFTGVESQSRLLHNALRGIPHNDHFEKETNPILLRIMAEREKYRPSPAAPRPQPPSRRKLLDRDLPVVEPKNDFALSYQTKNDAVDLQRALAKMAAHDHECEMGEEPEFAWGRNGRTFKRKKREASSGCSEWLTKRKGSMPTVTSTATQPSVEASMPVQLNTSSSSNEVQLNDNGMLLQGCCINENIQIDKDGEYSAQAPALMVEGAHIHGTGEIIPCPLCGVVLPQAELIIHAATCGETH